MIYRYRKNLVNLFARLNRVAEDPSGNRLECLAIQEKLLRSISYIEGRIRSLKLQRKEYKIRLALTVEPRLTKQEAVQIKAGLVQIDQALDAYKSLIHIFKEIGDGLAFTYLDRWNIKPVSVRESPGFISGKQGSRMERKVLRSVFMAGGVAILNDITNNLRHGDVTVVANHQHSCEWRRIP